MSNEDILQVDDRTVLDYSPQYKEYFIEKIKHEYSNLCQRDQTLTDDFKQYVSNMENIIVKINYGYDLKLSLSYIDSKWEYDYTLNYTTGSTYTGTARVDSVGDIHINSIDEHKNWSSSKNHGEHDISVYSKSGRYYHAHCRDAILDDETKKNCVTLKNLDCIDPELNKLAKKVFFYDSVTSLMEMPSNARKESEDYLRELTRFDSPRNIRFVKVNYFGLNTAKAYFFPKSFNVSVDYKGVKYEQNDITLDLLESKGEETEHYKDFERLKKKYENKTFGILITFLSYVAVCTHAILLVIIYSQIFGVPDFLHIFEHENAFMIKVFHRFSFLIFIIIAGLTALGIFIVRSIVHNYRCRVSYDANQSLYVLENSLKSEYRKNNVINFLKFIVIAAISGTLTYVLWFL